MFSSQERLYQHMSIIHGEKIECKFCNRKVMRNYFKTHIKLHEKGGNFKCDHCPLEYAVKWSLTVHLWKHKKFKESCSKCKITFVSRFHLKKHRCTQTDPNPFKCDLCPKSYAVIQNLRLHLQNVHLMERNFECLICHKKCSTKGALDTHMGVHVKSKNFKCKTCSGLFSSKFNLRQHERRIHSKLV